MLNRLKQMDRAKIYLVIAQVFFLGIGYVTQVLLSKVIFSAGQFADYQFVNFLTNVFNLFIAASTPVVLSRNLAKKDTVDVGREFINSTVAMSALIGGQILITTVIGLVAMAAGSITSNVFIYIFLSVVQVLTFGLMNISNYYLIGLRNIQLFFKVYVFYVALKSIVMLGVSALTQDISLVLIFLIAIEFMQLIINIVIIKLNISELRAKFSWQSAKVYISKTWDVLISNLVLFGISNLAVVLSYFGLKDSNFNEFNIFTLVYPWALIPFYIISSLGNIYVVDFSSGRETMQNVRAILRRVVTSSVVVAVGALVMSAGFFLVIYRADFETFVPFILLLLPNGVVIAVISILISIFQGSDTVHKLRTSIAGLTVAYIVVSLLFRDLKLIILIGDIINVIFLVLLLSKLFNNEKAPGLPTQA